ncbi:MAG: sigma-54 interaction domain-containing protein [Burkholderiaceae bacterium]
MEIPASLLSPATGRHAEDLRGWLEHLEDACEGAVVVDREGHVMWLSERYAHKLGLASADVARGRDVEDVIPNSRMREVACRGPAATTPPLDILDLGSRQFVVTRMPLTDAGGQLLGALGMVLADHVRSLDPLVDRLQQLRGAGAASRRMPPAARRARHDFDAILGDSPACVELRRLGRRAARFDVNVLLRGETGTGKELLAHAIHAASARADKPFVALNVAAVPESLLEAEFFGTAPGAYTGADRRGRDGKFRLADGGTLFLDEVGDMPPAVQAKLLRVLQDGEVEPLGANVVHAVDVRVLAATSLDLEARVRQGRFRADLFYRLNVLQVTVPPLRERLADLPVLGAALLAELARESRLPTRTLSDEAVDELARHDWPGNVRELRNVLAQAVLLGEGETVSAPDVRRVLPAAAPTPTPEARGATLAQQVAVAERAAIAQALAAAAGNKSRAARRLGISRATLYEKMTLLGLAA